MFRVAVCEDCPLQAEIIVELLNKYQAEKPCIEVRPYCFTSGEELLERFASDSDYDLFLLGIFLPGINGIKLAEKIRKRNDDVPLVFLTKSKDYALKAFGVWATQYIVKPVNEKSLFPVLDKLVHVSNERKERYFAVATPERIVKIPYSSIISVELARRTLLICLKDGSKLISKYVREPFTDAIAPLLQDSRFLHAHRSYVLNMERVKELLSDRFVLEQDIVVPVPRYRYAEVKVKFLNFIAAQGARE